MDAVDAETTNPATMPTPASATPLCKNNLRMSPRRAPRAMRIPLRISLAEAANTLVVSAYTFSENALRLPAIDGPAVNRRVHPSQRAIIGFTFVARHAGRYLSSA